MSVVITNKETFNGANFSDWAFGEGISPVEKCIIEAYLDKNAKTIEAGTGGGRIVLGMQELGFKSLYGFDYLPKFIEQARQRDKTGSISFSVEDATTLTYPNNEFDQLVYLQQILCCIEDENARLSAFKNAYRILKPGGTALFSFLYFESRIQSSFHRTYLAYLQGLRKLFNSEFSIQSIPLLKLGGKPNLGAIFDRQPYTYWYRLQEVYQILKDVNFKIVALGSDLQLRRGKMLTSLEDMKNEPIEGMLYFVCKK